MEANQRSGSCYRTARQPIGNKNVLSRLNDELELFHNMQILREYLMEVP